MARRRSHNNCKCRLRRANLILMTSELLTISEVRRRTQNGFLTARVHAQVESAAARATREGKPYCEISIADACDRMMLR
ncbi:MAG: hypothetical protein DME44_07135, partial [Verrucomicrobia bacterium]